MDRMIANFFDEVSGCTTCFGNDQIFVPPCKLTRPDPPPRIFIIGEQPDREGCLVSGTNGLDRSDPTVDQLLEYMKAAEIDEDDVFYTTAVLCVPRDSSLRGPRPTHKEAKACSTHLEKLIQIVSPRLIVPLGHTSILAVQWIYKSWTELRQYILNYDVGNVLEKDGVAVYPLYHTSPATLKVRSKPRQMRDWKRLPEVLESLRTPAR